ncbi:sensor histidine kinase [Hyphomonas oceanitis]|uniref:sensor histidine kinase n=1 Tax=Hyphomonas oceanitis TaxID=81033 RepID=UPI0030036B63
MYKIRPKPPTETNRIDRPVPGSFDFQQAFELSPSPLMILNRDLDYVYANAAYLATTGCTLSEIQGRNVFEAFPETEARTALFRAAFEQAFAGSENVLMTEPYAIPVDGGGMREIVWICTQIPLRNAAGEVEYVMQNAVDITEKHQREQENRVLMRELDHRVKNSLATMQAVTRMSLVDSKSMQEARDDLLARMHAMSEVQNLLVERNWAGSNIEAVLSNALIPFGYEPDGASRITLDGPHARVTAKQAQALSMALHELATNAAKYGALSNDEGTVHVGWTFNNTNGSHFDLTWRESGGPAVTKPTRRGFGMTMLTRILAQEINGDLSLDYKPDGLVCKMEGWLDNGK